MPETVTLRDSAGRAYGVPQEQVAAYVAQGFRPESDSEGVERTAAETFHAEHGGVGGAVGSALAGGLSGLTLGGSDLALGALGADRVVRHMEAEHPYATGAATVGGALLPALLSGGATAGESAAGIGARILAHSPAGLVQRGGRAIAGLGEGAGLVGRVAAGTAGAAAEGAGYGGGQYLTETALEDKPLSAEGFVAGMGHGALFAAPIGAAGTLASATLQRARSLFPRAEVSAAAAAGVKEQASSSLAQAVRDGDQMAAAAERKLSDVDAKSQMAQAGETVTRRVFGEAHPQALADQVTGAVDRQQVTQALQGYQQARQQFEEWIATEADPELERALTGLRPGELQTPAIGAPAVPVGEFGAPGARGIKSPEEIAAKADGALSEPRFAGGTPPADQPVTRQLRGMGGPEIPAQEIVQRGAADEGTAIGKRRAPAAAPEAIPDHAAIKAHEVKADAPLEATVSARAIAERGYYEPPARGGVALEEADPVRMANARKAIAEGQREAIDLNVTQSGKITVTGGRHRLQAAIEADAPIKVKWSTGAEPAESDVLRHGASAAAPATDTLSGLLRGTAAKLEAGESLAEMGAPARASYKAAKAERTAAAAEHFRGRALEARAAAEPELGPATLRRRVADLDNISAELEAARKPAPAEPDALAARILRNAEAGGSPTAEEAIARRPKVDIPADKPSPEPRPMTKQEIAEQRGRFRAASQEQRAAKAIMRHNGKDVDIGPSLGRAAKAIGDVEAANATLVDVLGTEAPASAAEQAKAYRAAVGQTNERAAASSAKAAADLKGKVPAADSTLVDDEITKALRQHDMRAAAAAGGAAAPAGGSIGGRLADVGSALEVLRAIGAHVPVLSHIPVIGPVLGLFFKARAVMSILGRKGGSIGRSTEGVIAQKAAATRDRIVAATGSILEGTAKAAGKAAHLAGPAVLLAGQLFPGGTKPESDKPRDLYAARMDEIARAQSPGAIDQAIAQRYPTSDPALHDAIVAQVQRGIAFLDSKAPKQTVLPGVLPGDGTWKISMAAIDEFAKYVHAVNDPVSVLEDLAKGHVYAEGAETLRVVYPQLYQYAQKELLRAAPEMAKTLPYPRRVMISILYGIPVDGTLSPSHAQYLQVPAPPAPAPKAPTISGPLRLGQQVMSPLDHRASGV